MGRQRPIRPLIEVAKAKGTEMAIKKNTDARANGKRQGMNWIRQQKRLAIYIRDGLACCYCGHGVEEDAKLTLDHLRPHSKGGSNNESNLVTCCHRCNSSRGTRSVWSFSRAVAEYINNGSLASDIESHVRRCSRRSLKVHVEVAKQLIARRGSAARALKDM